MSIRVVVIDDSAFMRKMISEILEENPRIKVVATARNGHDGLTKIKEFKPDVVTLDIEMPVMDGIETLKEIMDSCPLPVVMLSSLKKSDGIKTVQAISKGAVDFIEKPSGAISLNIKEIKDEIIEKVIVASGANVTNRVPMQVDQVKEPTSSNSSVTKFSDPAARTIVAIGTSTGGPKALLTVLTDLPKEFPAPILVVQHMPAGFTKSLAERLDKHANIHVKEATHGDIIRPGTAYIAPGDYQMKLRRIGMTVAIELTKDPKVNGHRPSVDVLFNSLAEIKKPNKLAVVLTGMGSDGAEGISILKQETENTIVIAESEESSIVYGMPKAAVLTNFVDSIENLKDVSKSLTKLVGR